MPQPQQALVHKWFTDRKFSTGPTRLDVGDEIAGQVHPDSDVTHINKEFGRLWPDDFFRMISKAA